MSNKILLHQDGKNKIITKIVICFNIAYEFEIKVSF